MQMQALEMRGAILNAAGYNGLTKFAHTEVAMIVDVGVLEANSQGS
tara:strand:+ start:933 stop:1070 length:138 start_codon:yes stop_codon:yes gene_type:complete